MFRVLYVAPILAYPPAGGPEMDIVNSVKALSRSAELHIAGTVQQDTVSSEAEAFFKDRSAAFHYVPSARTGYPARISRRVRRTVTGRTGLDADAAWILSYYRRHSMDAIWCDRGEELSVDLIHALKAADPTARVVCDTCAVYSQFILRELPFADSDARKQSILEAGRKKEAQERSLVTIADVTTAVSEIDAGYYRSISPAPESVMLFSNVVDVDAYQQVAPPAGFSKPAIVSPGTYYSVHSPMAEGAQWFVDQVLPLIRQTVPSVTTYFVGKGSDQHLRSILDGNDPRLVATGRVRSVLPFLSNADVCVVPLHFESGTRFKILEAGACGTPVVSTTLGAEGLPVQSERHLLLADTPDAFAAAVVRVLRDRELADRLAAELRTLVDAEFGIGRLAAEGTRVLDYLRR